MWRRMALVGALLYLVIMAFGVDWLSEHDDTLTVGEQRFGLLGPKADRIVSLGFRDPSAHIIVRRVEKQWQIGTQPIGLQDHKIANEILAALRNAEPVRVFQPEEVNLTDESAFGFSEQSFSLEVVLDDGALHYFKFGDTTPSGDLQYLRQRSRPEVFVMSGYIGREARALFARQIEKH